jgi:hypothetical protein
VIAALFGSVGVGSALPKCLGSFSFFTWTNCSGTYNFVSGNKYVGEFNYGKANGHARGTKLDGFRGWAGTTEGIKKAIEALTAKAKAANVKPLLDRINPDCVLSLTQIAEILNRERIPTVSGRGCWNSRLVGRVYKRLAV